MLSNVERFHPVSPDTKSIEMFERLSITVSSLYGFDFIKYPGITTPAIPGPTFNSVYSCLSMCSPGLTPLFLVLRNKS
nr:unnamed protein product [Fasciola hepatica]